MSRVCMTIGEIRLKGFDRADGSVLVEGLKRELARMLSDPRARAEWTRPRRAEALRIPDSPILPGPAEARKFGRNLVRAIGRELKR